MRTIQRSGECVSIFSSRTLHHAATQLHHYYLNLQKTGDPYLGGGARFLLRDFMKLGQMMLDGGVWNGKRILSADFAKSAGAPHMELRGQNPEKYAYLAMRYGYLWWTVNYPYSLWRELRGSRRLAHGARAHTEVHSRGRRIG